MYEYLSGGGNAVTSSAALAGEGELMLAALSEDLAELSGVTLSILRDSRWPIPALANPAVDWIFIDPEDDIGQRLLKAARQADAVWLIAPETGGVLEQLCHLVESAGIPLLTSPAHAVRMAASKRATVEQLNCYAIPAVPTRVWEACAREPPWPFPVVIKVDDGVGCENTCIIRNRGQWDAFCHAHDGADRVMQPLIHGESLSLSALFADGAAVLLSVNRQQIEHQADGFILTGCLVQAISDPEGYFAALLRRVAAAMPGLWGYAGIDLIQDGQEWRVLEINPRLTSSYAGLKAALGINPARLVLELFRTGRLPCRPESPLNPVMISWVNHS